MTVSLQILDPSRSRLAPTLRRLLALLAITRGHWSIALVDDKSMAELHWQTLQLPTTTDVLTFDMRATRPHAKPKAQDLELETVICIDEARRRARELRHPLRHELLLYCLHSLLHVQGYNDLTPAGATRMHAREDELLQEIGIGPVYAPPAKRRTRDAKHSPRRPGRKSGNTPRPAGGAA